MVIRSWRIFADLSPKPIRVRTMTVTDMMAKKMTASRSCVIPQARPTAIATKMAAISFAVPGRLRNRTRANAPATATPAPILPLTSMITSAIAGGMMASVVAIEAVCFVRNWKTSAVPMPRASARKMLARNMGIDILNTLSE